jgi:hypothetical protein
MSCRRDQAFPPRQPDQVRKLVPDDVFAGLLTGTRVRKERRRAQPNAPPSPEPGSAGDSGVVDNGRRSSAPFVLSLDMDIDVHALAPHAWPLSIE